MPKRLRFQLTILYLLAALGLIIVVGGGSYLLLQNYLEKTTDLTLQYKMATQFRQYGLPLPAELAQAERDWLDSNARFSTAPPAVSHPSSPPASREDGQDSSDEQEGGIDSLPEQGESAWEDVYNGELAAVYVLQLDDASQIITTAALPSSPILQDRQAGAAALEKGYDLRTARLPNGAQARLLTYRISAPGGLALLQVGRLLGDQARILNRFLAGVLILAGISVLLLALVSWWLAGRTLGPAQKAWELQQTFVSNASHELRTPLTLIRATAEYALRNGELIQQQEALQDVLDESDYMNRLVDDLLLLSRLDAHRLELKKEVIDLDQLLQDICRQVEKLAADKGIQLTLENSQGSIQGDPLRVRQVLLILLDNALRFTPAGGEIHLGSHVAGKLTHIQVTDSGAGIPPEHLPHIFERFYQVSPPGVDQARSNGLGLAIAKGLIEAQGGAISITSQVGKGTRVTLSLPSAVLPRRDLPK